MNGNEILPDKNLYCKLNNLKIGIAMWTEKWCFVSFLVKDAYDW